VWEMKHEKDRGGYRETVGLLRNSTYREELPAVVLDPKQRSKQTVIWIDEAGKTGLFLDGAPSRPRPEVEKLLATGARVVGADLLYQGEFAADDKVLTQTRRVKNSREAAAFTFGYNRALFAQRVHDILTLARFIKDDDRNSTVLDVVGLGRAGPWVATARAQSQGAIDRAVIDTGGFRFGKLLEIHGVDFLPGGAKYGDLPNLLALGAPGKLWLAGEGKQPPPAVRARYETSSARKNLALYDGSRQQAREAAVEWLLANAGN